MKLFEPSGQGEGHLVGVPAGEDSPSPEVPEKRVVWHDGKTIEIDGKPKVRRRKRNEDRVEHPCTCLDYGATGKIPAKAKHAQTAYDLCPGRNPGIDRGHCQESWRCAAQGGGRVCPHRRRCRAIHRLAGPWHR